MQLICGRINSLSTSCECISSIKLFTACTENDNLPCLLCGRKKRLVNASFHFQLSSHRTSFVWGKKRIAHNLQPVQSGEPPAESNLCNPARRLRSNGCILFYFSRAQWLNPFTGDSTRRSARRPYGVTQSPLHDAKCSTRVGR